MQTGDSGPVKKFQDMIDKILTTFNKTHNLKEGEKEKPQKDPKEFMNDEDEEYKKQKEQEEKEHLKHQEMEK